MGKQERIVHQSPYASLGSFEQQSEEIHILQVEASENRNAIHQIEDLLKELVALKIDESKNNNVNYDMVNSLSVL